MPSTGEYEEPDAAAAFSNAAKVVRLALQECGFAIAAFVDHHRVGSPGQGPNLRPHLPRLEWEECGGANAWQWRHGQCRNDP